MVIPFTDRVSLKAVLIFASFVFLLQQLEHTDSTFSLLTATFVVLSALAYNAAGGISYPSGAYIFFNALLTAIVGLTWKLFLGEPGESYLHAPNKTLLAYCAGMVVMGSAAALSHRLRSRRALLPTLDIDTMRYAALGCFLVGAIVQFVTTRFIGQVGTISSALHQLNYLPRLAIIFATVYQMSKSGGKSSTNWIVWLSGGLMLFYGLLDFSKEGIFTPLVTWLLTAILYRYKFTWKQIAALIVFFALAQFVLVPFSQYGRRSRNTSTSQAQSAQAAIEYLRDPFGTREAYLEDLEASEYQSGPHLYSTPQGFVDRLNMITFDDALIARTDEGYQYGLLPIWAAYGNIVPHFLWKDKPFLTFGNEFAHEIGLLQEDDNSTGISFSPIGDLYHEATWLGILALFPPIIFLYFFITDSLTGSVRDSPFALLPIAVAAHVAPEGMIGAAIYLQTYGAVLMIVIAYLAKHVLARVTRLAMGGDRVRVLRTRDFILGTRPSAVPVQAVPTPGPRLK